MANPIMLAALGPLEIVLLLVLIGLYFLPTIIAGSRGHHQFWPIAIINFFFGWTFIGWVVALAWSASHLSGR